MQRRGRFVIREVRRCGKVLQMIGTIRTPAVFLDPMNPLTIYNFVVISLLLLHCVI